MSKLSSLISFLLLLVILSANLVHAQDGETPLPALTDTPTPVPDEPLSAEPTWPPLPVDIVAVTITAADELGLVGELYLLDTAHPTVLLLHQLYTDRHSWEPEVIPVLLAWGYNVLAVDLRGHGQTRGGVNWEQAVNDTQLWIDWLHAHNLNAVFLMGSSMGSSLAITGCANDPFCLGAVAISPGWNYYEVSVQDAFAERLDTRPVLIVHAQRDYWPAVGVPRMLEVATNPVDVLTFSGNAHGMDLFTTEETLLSEINTWMSQHAG